MGRLSSILICAATTAAVAQTDPAMQALALKVAAAGVARIEARHAGANGPPLQAALAALDVRSRQVRVLADLHPDPRYLRPSQVHRDAGSPLRPLVYAAALESRKFTLSSQLEDSSLATGEAPGRRVWLREALEGNLKFPAIRAGMEVGVRAVRQELLALGLDKSPFNRPDLSLLGSTIDATPLQVANAFASLADRGRWCVCLTSDLAIAAWIGYDTYDPLPEGETSLVAALPICLDFAEAVHAKPATPEMPAGIVRVGGELYLRGTEPGKRRR
jgi:membrane carboxypeptidase/penicillin-binding protein